ncbi:hypothetical protein E2C06_24405 [Dankookia rubra]|uniref:Calcium-binding protein n=1 Tax=Dankookia rubra TaxID=1442381 RepID=A0A4R5QBQ3_9PROT|nr:hypothetical protein [Dankookia rubra]TDH60019.1 hypothetical protein E2C06_24405 [Dankookia rubra]
MVPDSKMRSATTLMKQSATFGIVGFDHQSILPGTNPALLPNAAALMAPLPDALSSEPFTPASDGTTALFNGGVTVTTTGFGTDSEHTTYDVSGAWNSVKNASVTADAPAHLTFSGFVHIDAVVGLGSDQGSTVELDGVKRANLVMGEGADRIDVRVLSNNDDWSNAFRANTGDGDDVVSFSLFDAAGAAAADPTFAAALATKLTYDYTGAFTQIYLDLGAGDDAASGLAGNDIMDGGSGSSFLLGGGGNDEFYVDGRGGKVSWSTITDWQAGDHLGLRGWQPGVSQAAWVEHAGTAGYEGATLQADLNGDDVTDTSITWTGLSPEQVPVPTTAHADGMLWFA